MSKLIIVLVCFSMFGCISVNSRIHEPNPPENIVIITTFMGIHIPVLIEKGFFDDPENYMTEKEFDKLYEQAEPSEPDDTNHEI